MCGKAGNNRSDLVEWMFADLIPPEITEVVLNKSSLVLDGEEQLYISVKPESVDISNEKIIWESIDESVATVTQNGLVKTVGPGTTTIRVTVLGKSAECIVTVKESIKPIFIKEDGITIPIEQTTQLTLESETDFSSENVEWTTLDGTIVKVDENGKITALQQGTTTIMATIGEKNATAEITVSGKLGDVDRDGNITAYDAYKALETSVDYLIDVDIDKERILTSDVNKNGVPESEDAYNILEYSVGLKDKI